MRKSGTPVIKTQMSCSQAQNKINTGFINIDIPTDAANLVNCFVFVVYTSIYCLRDILNSDTGHQLSHILLANLTPHVRYC